MDEWKFILAYSIFILIAIFISRTRVGYTIIYYVLMLAILLLVVIEAPRISEALAPLANKWQLASTATKDTTGNVF